MSEAAKKSPNGYRTQDKGHKRKGCIDCAAEGITTNRKAPYPGPRCHSHNRLQKAKRKNLTREQRWEKVYNLTPEQYWAIYEYQDGRCYICRRRNGRTKALSVDHDHSCCPGPTSCGECVRGLLCNNPCNRYLGHIKDDPAAAERMADYLRDPPARHVLDNWPK